jgi:hypothetical protein
MREGPDDEELANLNQEFSDIIVEGGLERVESSPAEVGDVDALDLDRIAFVFDRRHFGRLRMLIDRLNDLVVAPKDFHLPEPMTEEHAERPW